MIDWTQPIYAHRTRLGAGRTLPEVKVDRSYAERPGSTPVAFSRGLWAEGAGGTWYIDSEGRGIGGLGPDGYIGHFVISNEPEPVVEKVIEFRTITPFWPALLGGQFGGLRRAFTRVFGTRAKSP